MLKWWLLSKIGKRKEKKGIRKVKTRKERQQLREIKGSFPSANYRRKTPDF